MADYVSLGRSTVMLHAAPLGFDASTLEPWGALRTAAASPHDEAVPTGPGLAQVIRAHGVTTARLTAALFNAVVDDDPRHLAGLQELLIGGEVSVGGVSRAALHGSGSGHRAHQRLRPDRVHDLRHHASYRCGVARQRPFHPDRQADQPHHLVPVFNRRGELVPDGLVGELFIGGLGVGRLPGPT